MGKTPLYDINPHSQLDSDNCKSDFKSIQYSLDGTEQAQDYYNSSEATLTELLSTKTKDLTMNISVPCVHSKVQFEHTAVCKCFHLNIKVIEKKLYSRNIFERMICKNNAKRCV